MPENQIQQPDKAPPDKEIPDRWKDAIREARETVKWFHAVLIDEYYTPEEMERAIRAGLKVEPLECVLMDSSEVVRRYEMRIEIMQHRLTTLKKKAGMKL